VVQLHRKASGIPQRLAILPGTFNPPTIAHLALARAALAHAGEVLFALPQVFPHKPYEGAAFEHRLEMLRQATVHEPRYSIASTETGLFIDIAHAIQPHYSGARLSVVCGSDAADRIVNWDYGRPDAIREMLDEFDLLVASRRGEYQPPAGLAQHIYPLALDSDYSEVSATEVRDRLAAGRPWEYLVPDSIRELVRRFYSPAAIE
jgi:nicotinate (nicotinamide) nucleotide adenylyltransferase